MNMMSHKEIGIGNLLTSGLTQAEPRCHHRPHQGNRLPMASRSWSCATLTRSVTRSCSPKLRAVAVHARETAKKIAASPIVEQEGELCFTLYNAAGDCIRPRRGSSSTSAPWARRSLRSRTTGKPTRPSTPVT